MVILNALSWMSYFKLYRSQSCPTSTKKQWMKQETIIFLIILKNKNDQKKLTTSAFLYSSASVHAMRIISSNFCVLLGDPEIKAIIKSYNRFSPWNRSIPLCTWKYFSKLTLISHTGWINQNKTEHKGKAFTKHIQRRKKIKLILMTQQLNSLNLLFFYFLFFFIILTYGKS